MRANAILRNPYTLRKYALGTTNVTPDGDDPRKKFLQSIQGQTYDASKHPTFKSAFDASRAANSMYFSYGGKVYNTFTPEEVNKVKQDAATNQLPGNPSATDILRQYKEMEGISSITGNPNVTDPHQQYYSNLMGGVMGSRGSNTQPPVNNNTNNTDNPQFTIGNYHSFNYGNFMEPDKTYVDLPNPQGGTATSFTSDSPTSNGSNYIGNNFDISGRDMGGYSNFIEPDKTRVALDPILFNKSPNFNNEGEKWVKGDKVGYLMDKYNIKLTPEQEKNARNFYNDNEFLIDAIGPENLIDYFGKDKVLNYSTSTSSKDKPRISIEPPTSSGNDSKYNEYHRYYDKISISNKWKNPTFANSDDNMNVMDDRSYTGTIPLEVQKELDIMRNRGKANIGKLTEEEKKYIRSFDNIKNLKEFDELDYSQNGIYPFMGSDSATSPLRAALLTHSNPVVRNIIKDKMAWYNSRKSLTGISTHGNNIIPNKGQELNEVEAEGLNENRLRLYRSSSKRTGINNFIDEGIMEGKLSIPARHIKEAQNRIDMFIKNSKIDILSNSEAIKAIEAQLNIHNDNLTLAVYRAKRKGLQSTKTNKTVTSAPADTSSSVPTTQRSSSPKSLYTPPKDTTITDTVGGKPFSRRTYNPGMPFIQDTTKKESIKRKSKYSMGTQRINLQDPYTLPKYGYGSMGVYQQDVPEYQEVSAFNTGKKQTRGKSIGSAVGSAIGALGYLIPGAGAAIGPATTALGGMAGSAIGGAAGKKGDLKDAQGKFGDYNNIRNNVMTFNRNQASSPLGNEKSTIPFNAGIDPMVSNNQQLSNYNTSIQSTPSESIPFRNTTQPFQPWITPDQVMAISQSLANTGGSMAGSAMGGGGGGGIMGMLGGMGKGGGLNVGTALGGTPPTTAGGGGSSFGGRMQGMFGGGGNSGMFFNRQPNQSMGASPVGTSNTMPSFFNQNFGQGMKNNPWQNIGTGYYKEGSSKIDLEGIKDYGNTIPFQHAYNKARQEGNFFFKWNGQPYNAMSAEEANYLRQEVRGNSEQGYSGDPMYSQEQDPYGVQALKYAGSINEGPGSDIYGNVQNQFNTNRQAGLGMESIQTPLPIQQPDSTGIGIPPTNAVPPQQSGQPSQPAPLPNQQGRLDTIPPVDTTQVPNSYNSMVYPEADTSNTTTNIPNTATAQRDSIPPYQHQQFGPEMPNVNATTDWGSVGVGAGATVGGGLLGAGTLYGAYKGLKKLGIIKGKSTPTLKAPTIANAASNAATNNTPLSKNTATNQQFLTPHLQSRKNLAASKAAAINTAANTAIQTAQQAIPSVNTAANTAQQTVQNAAPPVQTPPANTANNTATNAAASTPTQVGPTKPKTLQGIGPGRSNANPAVNYNSVLQALKVDKANKVTTNSDILWDAMGDIAKEVKETTGKELTVKQQNLLTTYIQSWHPKDLNEVVKQFEGKSGLTGDMIRSMFSSKKMQAIIAGLGLVALAVTPSETWASTGETIKQNAKNSLTPESMLRNVANSTTMGGAATSAYDYANRFYKDVKDKNYEGVYDTGMELAGEAMGPIQTAASLLHKGHNYLYNTFGKNSTYQKASDEHFKHTRGGNKLEKGTRLVNPFLTSYAKGSNSIDTNARKAYLDYARGNAVDYRSLGSHTDAHNAAKKAGNQYFLYGDQVYNVDPTVAKKDFEAQKAFYTSMPNAASSPNSGYYNSNTAVPYNPGAQPSTYSDPSMSIYEMSRIHNPRNPSIPFPTQPLPNTIPTDVYSNPYSTQDQELIIARAKHDARNPINPAILNKPSRYDTMSTEQLIQEIKNRNAAGAGKRTYAEGSSKIYGKEAYQSYVTNTAKDYNKYPDRASAYKAAQQAGDQYFMHGNQPYYVDQAKSQADLAKYTNMYSYMDNPVQTGQSIQNSPNQFDNMPLSMNMPPIHTTAVESTQGTPPMDSGPVYRMNNPVPKEEPVMEQAYGNFMNSTGGGNFQHPIPPMEGTIQKDKWGNDLSMKSDRGKTLGDYHNEFFNSNFYKKYGKGRISDDDYKYLMASSIEQTGYPYTSISMMTSEIGDKNPNDKQRAYSNEGVRTPRADGQVYRGPFHFQKNQEEYNANLDNGYGFQFQGDPERDRTIPQWADALDKYNAAIEASDMNQRGVSQGQPYMDADTTSRFKLPPLQMLWNQDRSAMPQFNGHNNYNTLYGVDNNPQRPEVDAINKELFYPDINYDGKSPIPYQQPTLRKGKGVVPQFTYRKNPNLQRKEQGSSAILPFETPLSRDAKPSKEALVESGELILHRYEKPTEKGVSLKFDLIEDVKGERHSGPNGGERRTLFQDDVVVPRNQRSKFLKHYKSGDTKAIERERLKLPEDKPQYKGGIRTIDIRNSPTYGNVKPVPTKRQPNVTISSGDTLQTYNPYQGAENPIYTMESMGNEKFSNAMGRLPGDKFTVPEQPEDSRFLQVGPQPQPIQSQPQGPLSSIPNFPSTINPEAINAYMQPNVDGGLHEGETNREPVGEQPFNYGEYPGYTPHAYIPNLNFDNRQFQSPSRLQTQQMMPTYMGYSDQGAPDRRMIEEQYNEALKQIDSSGGSESQKQAMRQQLQSNIMKTNLGMASQTNQRLDQINQSNMQAANQASGMNAQLFQQTKQMQLAENERANQFNNQIIDNNMDLGNRNYENAMNVINANNLTKNQHDYNAWAYKLGTSADLYKFNRDRELYGQYHEAVRPATPDEVVTGHEVSAGVNPTTTNAPTGNLKNWGITLNPYTFNNTYRNALQYKFEPAKGTKK